MTKLTKVVSHEYVTNKLFHQNNNHSFDYYKPTKNTTTFIFIKKGGYFQ